MINGILYSSLALLIFSFGWVGSATTISIECKKLGAFYVGSNVYTCEVKDKK
jgi:hypothetical protein